MRGPSTTRFQLGAATLSGLALALAFPKPDLHLLVWVGLAPMLVAVAGASPWRAWWLGLWTGVVYRAGTLYWLVPVMTRFGGLPVPMALLAAGALVSYLASFTGLFAVVAARFDVRTRYAAPALAAAWVGLEFGMARLLTGFPYNLLGHAAGRGEILGQGADIAGVYGLSAVAVLVNVAIAAAFARGRSWTVSTGCAAGAVVATTGYGLVVLAGAPAVTATGARATEGAIPVGLVQGNVAQGAKWDPAEASTILGRHLDLSRSAVEGGASLVVWPESSWPDPYGVERDVFARRSLMEVSLAGGAALLVGTTHVEETGTGFSVANSAVLVDADGSWPGRYDKVRLVPFGEYVPLRAVLGFLGPLVHAVGSLEPGALNQPLLRAPAAEIPPFGVAICYEVVFPHIVRDQVARGAEFLVTITNDAWYGQSSGPYQHLAMARMRAIETRRWLVRAANTGISALVDPWGRIVARSELEETTVLHGKIVPRRGLTTYVALGDLFALMCAVAMLYLLMRSLSRPPGSAGPAGAVGPMSRSTPENAA